MLCVLSHFSRLQFRATLWSVACQAPPSMEFSRQEYWSELPCPPPGDLPDSETNLHLLHCRQIRYCWVTGEAGGMSLTEAKCQVWKWKEKRLGISYLTPSRKFTMKNENVKHIELGSWIKDQGWKKHRVQTLVIGTPPLYNTRSLWIVKLGMDEA